MTDPISDMLIRIKNALAVKKSKVLIPFSVQRENILKILFTYGFVGPFRRIKRKNERLLELQLAYTDQGKAPIHDIKRISKPSRRVYIKAKDIKPTKGGLGISIISTSRGMMATHRAKKEQLGGELICEIW